MSKMKTLLFLCKHCFEEVVISYVCPKCQARACMLCAMENKWKCPGCKAKLA